MNDVMVLSVIIPVYNGDKYLDRSIKSLENCPRSDVEFIFIDDGSTDKSLERIENAAQKDVRFVCRHISNTGVSNARNVGLELAKGKFITFLDADDYIDESSGWKNIFDIITILNSESYDIAIAGYYIIRNDKKTEKIIDLENDISDVWKAAATTSNLNSVWAKIYRNDIIRENSIRFPVDVKVGEDYSFFVDYIKNCKKPYVSSLLFMCYCINDSSIMNSTGIADILSGINQCRIKANELANLKDFSYKRQYDFYFFRTITAALTKCASSMKMREYYRSYKYVIKSSLCKDIVDVIVIKDLPLRRKVECIVVKYNLPFGFLFFKIRSKILEVARY